MPVDLDKMTPDKLMVLNYRIVERIKFLDSKQGHKEVLVDNTGPCVF